MPRDFDPRRHPRWPRGAPDDAEGDGQGGRFTDTGGLAESLAGSLRGATTGPWHERASDQIGERRGEHPRQQYNTRVVDAGQRQWNVNFENRHEPGNDDPALAQAISDYNIAQARNDTAAMDVAVDTLRTHLEVHYPEEWRGAFPARPEPREAPRAANRDLRNQQMLSTGREIQARIEAGNDGDPDEGLAIRIEALDRHIGRTGHRVEADREADALEQYILDDPEGLIAAHPYTRPEPTEAPLRGAGGPAAGWSQADMRDAGTVGDFARRIREGVQHRPEDPQAEHDMMVARAAYLLEQDMLARDASFHDATLDDLTQDIHLAGTLPEQQQALQRLREHISRDYPEYGGQLEAALAPVDDSQYRLLDADSPAVINGYLASGFSVQVRDNVDHQWRDVARAEQIDTDLYRLHYRNGSYMTTASANMRVRNPDPASEPGPDETAIEASRLANAVQAAPPYSFAVEGNTTGGYYLIVSAHQEHGDFIFVTDTGVHIARTPNQLVRYTDLGGSAGPGAGHAGTVRDLLNAYRERGNTGDWDREFWVTLGDGREVRMVDAGRDENAGTAWIMDVGGMTHDLSLGNPIQWRVGGAPPDPGWSAPVVGNPNLFQAVLRSTPEIRIQIQDDYGQWVDVVSVADAANGRVVLHLADGGQVYGLEMDSQVTYRVRRADALQPLPAGFDPGRAPGGMTGGPGEEQQRLLDERIRNDNYNTAVYDRARELMDSIPEEDRDDPDMGSRQLAEVMQTYLDASTNPDDPESIDAAADDLVDTLSDWDIWFDADGNRVDRMAQSTAPIRPNYDNGALPVGTTSLPASVADAQSALPRRASVQDVQPGQTLADALARMQGGYASGSDLPPGYRQLLHDMYDYTDRHTGLRAEIDDNATAVNSGQVNLQGKIFDSDGNQVGKFTRAIGPGTGIYHSYFKITDPGQQGGGFTSRWFEQVKQQYRDQGFTHVTVSANLDVGGYAWAKIGFDFESRSSAGSMLERAKGTGEVKHAVGELSDETMEELEELRRRWYNDEWITPLEISQIGWRQRDRDEFDGYPRATDNGDVIEMWLGKYIMLGSSWEGKLTL